MITLIDVRSVLSGSGRPQSDLITRPTGRRVRDGIVAALAAAGADVVVLDFSHIRLMDCSCADEVLAKLVIDTPGPVFVVRGLADHHVVPVAQVLERHQVALVIEQDGGVDLLGPVAERDRSAFQQLATCGVAAPDELAAGLSWPVEDAAAVLDDLAGRRLILSAQGRYRAPTAAA